MGYPIIFKTKICKLSDGNIIHFTLQGCNNDTEGRRSDDWRGTYFTAQDWENWIQKWENTESDGSYDLKIGSRWTNFKGYGKHLRTMTNRAVSFEELRDVYHLRGIKLTAVEYHPDGISSPTILDPKSNEVDRIAYDIMYGRIKGWLSHCIDYLYSEYQIVEALRNEDVISFNICPYKRVCMPCA